MDFQNVSLIAGPIVGAIGGFISALIIFFSAEVWWKPRLAERQRRKDVLLQRLNLLYGPMYQVYLEAYSRFDAWRESNPSSMVARQAFFDKETGDLVAEELLSKYAGYASQDLLRGWTQLKIATEEHQKTLRRAILAAIVTREFNSIRKELKLDYSARELATGEISLPNVPDGSAGVEKRQLPPPPPAEWPRDSD